jgi:hypothetical protein
VSTPYFNATIEHRSAFYKVKQNIPAASINGRLLRYKVKEVRDAALYTRSGVVVSR